MSDGAYSLSVAVCLFADEQLLDYGGPLDLPERGRVHAVAPPAAHVRRTKRQRARAGSWTRRTNEQLVKKTSKQFDVLVVPGGWGTTPRVVPPALLQFLQKQAPGAQYILSVCTGSWLLAQAGLLDGKRATTNKALFDVVASRTDSSIDWVHQARWVVDGKYWTASGGTAGLDMAFGWVGHLVGKDVAAQLALAIEHAPRAQDDDAFAGAWTSEKKKALVEGPAVKDARTDSVYCS